MHHFVLPSLLGLLISAAPVSQQPPVRSEPPTARFTVRIENVSTSSTLKLSNGTTAPAPTAPVLWVVHTNSDPIFTAGTVDRGQGLESLSEDGDPSRLAKTLEAKPGTVAVGFVNRPIGANEPGPILPGTAYEISFNASPGQRLSLAMMFGQSNDLFYGTDGSGIALFDDAGKPLSGEITSRLILWDAGTEVNQEPGLGSDQGPRQKGPNTGSSERRSVAPVHDGYTYPQVGEVIKVSVTAQLRTAENR